MPAYATRERKLARPHFRLFWEEQGAALKGHAGKAVFDMEEEMEDRPIFTELEIIAGIRLVSGNGEKGKPHYKRTTEKRVQAAESPPLLSVRFLWKPW